MHRWIILALGLALVGCGASFERHLAYAEQQSPLMRDRWVRHAVLTPTDRSPGERLPLVVFLHGGGDDEASFDRHGVSLRLQQAMSDGRIPRAVVLLPAGNLGFWANWHDGTWRYEDWVMDELVPEVAREHQTLPCPEHCHVMGVSMGGSGTLRFALHRRWASATMISAPVLDTDAMINLAQNPLLVPIIPMDRIFGPTRDRGARSRVAHDDPFLRWAVPEDLGEMRLMVAWGSEDRGPIVSSSRRLVDHFEERGIPHESLEYDGNHSWRSWSPVIEEAFRRMVIAQR